MEKDIKKKLLNEKNKNCEKIDELDRKIKVLEINSLNSKITLPIVFSTFAYAGVMFLLPAIIESGFIPLELIQPFAVVVPAAIGITGEALIDKKLKIKKRLRDFSEAKTEKDKIEEKTRYKIEKEKLKNHNKVIDKALNDIAIDEYFINFISDRYKVTEKEVEEKFIEDTQKLLDQKNNELDILSTKKTLKEEFFKVRSKLQRFDYSIVGGVLGFLGPYFAYNLPTVCISLCGTNLPFSFLEFFAPGIVGGVAGVSYGIKKQKDETKAFRNINKDLGENALDNFTDNNELKMKLADNNIERFDLELEKVINDTAAIKVHLEKDKQKMNNTSKISDSKSVMNNFMKKLDNNELNYEKEVQATEELVLDDEFIEEQLDRYNKVLSSPIVKEMSGPKLIKKRITQRK